MTWSRSRKRRARQCHSLFDVDGKDYAHAIAGFKVCLSVIDKFGAHLNPVCGVRPLSWTVSCGGFDRLPGVMILELCRA